MWVSVWVCACVCECVGVGVFIAQGNVLELILFSYHVDPGMKLGSSGFEVGAFASAGRALSLLSLLSLSFSLCPSSALPQPSFSHLSTFPLRPPSLHPLSLPSLRLLNLEPRSTIYAGGELPSSWLFCKALY